MKKFLQQGNEEHQEFYDAPTPRRRSSRATQMSISLATKTPMRLLPKKPAQEELSAAEVNTYFAQLWQRVAIDKYSELK